MTRTAEYRKDRITHEKKIAQSVYDQGVTNAKNDPHCGVQKGPDHP